MTGGSGSRISASSGMNAGFYASRRTLQECYVLVAVIHLGTTSPELVTRVHLVITHRAAQLKRSPGESQVTTLPSTGRASGKPVPGGAGQARMSGALSAEGAEPRRASPVANRRGSATSHARQTSQQAGRHSLFLSSSRVHP